jgi:hypothetical protein
VKKVPLDRPHPKSLAEGQIDAIERTSIRLLPSGTNARGPTASLHRAAEHLEKRRSPSVSESLPCDTCRERVMVRKDSSPAGVVSMLMTKEKDRRPAIRTLRGWAISVLQEAGMIRECEEHGWMQDRADPHARGRALTIAREDPPAGVSPDQAVAEIRDVIDSIGDTCPECPPGSQ